MSFLRKGDLVYPVFMIYWFLLMAAVSLRKARAFFDRLSVKKIRQGTAASSSYRRALKGKRYVLQNPIFPKRKRRL